MRFSERLQYLLSEWKLAILLIVLIYALLLSINLGSMSMEWDEVNHFNGALLLTRGEIWQYAAINSFYPPMFNLVTAAYFVLAGASVLVGRLVTVTFSLLSLVVVYQIARKMYGIKVSLLSAILFAVMPGIIWLSRIALIETMLLFAFSFSMLFFFRWFQTNKKMDLSISVVAFAIGITVKYQILVVVPIIMLLSFLVLGKTDYLRTEIDKFVHSKRLFLLVVLIVIAAFLLYEFYVSGLLIDWLYAIQVGNTSQSLYSIRFPVPIFYLIEMTSPYYDMHPISLLLYGLGLTGMLFFAIRRKPQDKFLLIWFITIYIVFTIIPNRQWRYVTLLFPSLAISASELVSSTYRRIAKKWKSPKIGITRKHTAKIAAAVLIAFTVVGVFFSIVDSYSWITKDQTQVPIEQATVYLASINKENHSIAVLCPVNLFNKDMVWFYLNRSNASQTMVYNYPPLPVDAYASEFNSNDLVNYLQINGTRYLLLYENGGTVTYFNSSLTEQSVYGMLNSTNRFTLQTSFGKMPNRIFVVSFQ